MNQIPTIAFISLLTGLFAAGLVWYTWGLAENLRFIRRKPSEGPPAQTPTKAPEKAPEKAPAKVSQQR